METSLFHQNTFYPGFYSCHGDLYQQLLAKFLKFWLGLGPVPLEGVKGVCLFMACTCPKLNACMLYF